MVLVGEDAGSVSYVTGKTKAADEVGILNTTIRKPADISEEELLKINRRPQCRRYGGRNFDPAAAAETYRFG